MANVEPKTLEEMKILRSALKKIRQTDGQVDMAMALLALERLASKLRKRLACGEKELRVLGEVKPTPKPSVHRSTSEFEGMSGTLRLQLEGEGDDGAVVVQIFLSQDLGSVRFDANRGDWIGLRHVGYIADRVRAKIAEKLREPT